MNKQITLSLSALVGMVGLTAMIGVMTGGMAAIAFIVFRMITGV